MHLKGKRILVTGGANGCGEGTLRGLIAEGATVVSTDINVERGQWVAEDIGATDRLRFMPLDVSNRDQVFKVVDDAAAWMGGLDGIVNSGGNVLSCEPEDITDEMWDKIFDVHVKGTLYTNQAAFPHLKAAGGGTIVNFGSAAAIRGARTFAIYSAAKGAVFAWTRAVATDWGQYNIRANAIAPFMESSLQKQERGKSSEQDQRLSEGVRAVTKIRGTLGDAEKDLAPMIALLLSDGGTYITGQVLAVDGGFAMLGS